MVAATTAFSAVSAANVMATELDLTASGNTSGTIVGDVGGAAVFSDFFSQPTGTGVFQPFLTLDANGQTSTTSKKIEQAFNTDGFTAMYMDQLRPQWNERLRLSDLAKVAMNGSDYYVFLLDANEPGGGKSLISIDNIRIYTSATDNTATVGNDLSKLDQLGTLRWALNDPTKNADGTFNIDQWVKLDSSQENVEAGSSNSNGGSGKSDMAVYIPVTAFAGALSTDYLWFYNLNGVHYDADKDLAAESGYEEWRAVVAAAEVPPGGTPPPSVPDSGNTLMLLGTALAGAGLLMRYRFAPSQS